MKKEPAYLRLTLPQEDIYYEQLLYPDTPIYNIGANIEIEGPLHRESFELAFQELIHQHDSFRRRIEKQGDSLQFVLDERHPPLLDYTDFTSVPDPEKEAVRYMKEQFLKVFDLDSPKPLYRFCLLKVGEESHRLFSVYHHIITDGWGTSLMFKRLVKNYNEIREQGKVISEYPFSYSDFVEDDMAYRNSDSFEGDKAYWVDSCKNLTDIFNSIDKSNSDPAKSGREVIYVPRDLYNRMTGISKEKRSTTFHFIISALVLYLNRVYGTEQVSVGLPVLNRGKSIFKKTVGLFMGVLPLRVKVSSEISFEKLMETVRMQLRQDYRHQRFPLGKLVQELGLINEKSKLLNISLSYERHNYANHFKDTQTRVIPMSHQSERVGLAVYVREFDDSEDVKIDLDYNFNYFRKEQIQGFARHLSKLLQELCLEPGKKISEYEFMQAEERTTILEAFNKTDFKIDNSTTVLSMLKKKSSQYAVKTALRDSTTEWTYEALQQRSDEVAGYLLNLPMANGPIGVMMDRSVELVCVLIGIWKAGRSYIPLDPQLPQERLSYILSHSGASSLISDKSLSPAFEEYVELISVTDILSKARSGRARDIQLPRVKPSHTAYIIYTSGSTGNPKGVEVLHSSLTNFLKSMAETPGMTASDLLYSITTYSFDISILEFFLPLTVGAQLYIADKHTLEDPSRTLKELERIAPSMMQATPGFYQILIFNGWMGDNQMKLLCGGDKLSSQLANLLLERCNSLWNMYGPTETTIWSSIKEIKMPSESNNIGSPIHNTSFYVLDPNRNPLPTGAKGEIYIGGKGVARGYYNDLDKTRLRFMENPFKEGERMYRTGDHGYWTEGGEIIFLGREDQQVKVRGYRIELSDIEKNLAAISGIKEAVVTVRRDPAGTSMLVAFCTSGSQIESSVIKNQLRTRLPEYMIPDIIYRLGKIPLSPSCKVDRKQLTVRKIVVPNQKKTATTKLSPKHLEVIALWEAILGIKVNRLDISFFDIGGHSILASKLVAQLNTKFKTHLSLRHIFEYNTVGAQVSLLDRSSTKGSTELVKTAYRERYPVSPMQHGLWLSCQQQTVNSTYNMHASFTVLGTLFKERLEASMLKLLRDHELLISNFVDSDGQPEILLGSHKGLETFRIEEEEYQSKTELEEAATRFIEKAFDLETELLVSVKLYSLDSDYKKLVFKTHHLLVDGWSLGMMLNEVSQSYHAEQIDLNSAYMGLQYRDIAHWSRSRAKNKEPEHRPYFEEKLADFNPDLQLPSAREQMYSGEKDQLSLSPGETDRIMEFAAQVEASVFIILLACVNAFVYRSFGAQNFCVGVPVSGRDEEEGLQSVIGMLANTVPLLQSFEAKDSFISLISKTNHYFLQGLEHQEFPLYNIYQLTDGQKAAFDIVVTYQQENMHIPDYYPLGEATLVKEAWGNGLGRYPLVFNFLKNSEGIDCQIEFDAGFFPPTFTKDFSDRFLNTVSNLLDYPHRALHEVPTPTSRLKESSLKIDLHF